MEFTQQILEFGWSGKGKDLYPTCKVMNLADFSISKIELSAPYRFSWQLSSESFCPGYTNEAGEYVPCPNQSVIAAKYDRCKSCDKQDGFRAAFFYGAEPNAKMQKHLDQQHYIYLACFYPDKVKVGTSVKDRQYKRLIEQDALYANLVATAPGHMIQRLEADIATHLNLTHSIRTRGKQAGMFHKLNTSKAQSALSKLIQKLRSHPKLQKYLLAEIEVVDFTNYQHIAYPDQQVFAVDNPRRMVGTYFGLRGRQILVSSPDGSLLSHKTTNIVNRRLRHVEDELVAEVPETAKQQGLF